MKTDGWASCQWVPAFLSFVSVASSSNGERCDQCAVLVQRSALLSSVRSPRESTFDTEWLDIGTRRLPSTSPARLQQTSSRPAYKSNSHGVALRQRQIHDVSVFGNETAAVTLRELETKLKRRGFTSPRLDSKARATGQKVEKIDVSASAEIGRGVLKTALMQYKVLAKQVRSDAIWIVLVFLIVAIVSVAAVALCVGYDGRLGPEQQSAKEASMLVNGADGKRGTRLHLPHPQLQRNAYSGQAPPQSNRSLWARGNSDNSVSGTPQGASQDTSTRPPPPSMGRASAATPTYGRADGFTPGHSAASLKPETLFPAKQPGSRFTFGSRLASNRSVEGSPLSIPPSPMPSARTGHVQLCPNLVVPEGMELVFAVRDLLKPFKQLLSFSVVDLDCQPLSHVIVNETGKNCGILVQMLDETALAWVRTKPVHEGKGPAEICYPSGEIFAYMEKEEAVPTSRYMLRDTSGSRLYTFLGDLQEKAINVVTPGGGRLICDTERCQLGPDGLLHYQVRVAPGVDAGLVLCCLLALDKMEGCGASSGPSAPPGRSNSQISRNVC